ncbi:MAG: cobalamin-binding protein [Candidatus Kapaibacteriota bacterium]|jgi:iron complex transport system substrate-binding protein
MYKIRPYKRIVCLTEETTETLYNLGLDELIVGITRYTFRPAIARKTKPKVSGYIDAKFDKIIALQPDLVITWSDLQADITAELIRRGVEVICFNHRDINGILSMIYKLGSLLGESEKAEKYIEKLVAKLEKARLIGENRKHRPKVYFEEWYDPLISGITWVSEIIELCGGDDVYIQNRHFYDAKRRIIPTFEDVIPRNPDIMIASWCGKKFKKDMVLSRVGWDNINAIKNNEIYEIKSEIILQPGPAALTDGVEIIMNIIDNWEKK